MTKQTNIMDEILTDIKVTKEDLVAIKVADYEMDLLKREAEAKTHIKELKQAIKDAEKELETSCRGEVDNKYSNSIKDLRTTLCHMGFRDARLSFNVTPSIEEGGIRYSLTIGTGYNRPSTDGIVKMKRVQKALLKRIEGLRESLSTTQDLAIDVKEKLSKIKTQERLTRAAIAVAAISRRPGGKDLIESIRHTKSLPIPALLK